MQTTTHTPFKTFLAGFTTGIVFLALVAFRSDTYVPNQTTAEVMRYEGYYIFTDCTPVSAYETLGTVELLFTADTQYESIRNNLIKRSKKKHPEADGLIMHLDKSGIDRCVAIRFK